MRQSVATLQSPEWVEYEWVEGGSGPEGLPGRTLIGAGACILTTIGIAEIPIEKIVTREKVTDRSRDNAPVFREGVSTSLPGKTISIMAENSIPCHIFSLEPLHQVPLLDDPGNDNKHKRDAEKHEGIEER